ncbi:MAG: hypothetical protein ACFFD4_03795 [Candidatus Odinarchaeota archaeon]
MREEEIRKLLKIALMRESFSVFTEISRIDLVAIKNGLSHGFELKSVNGNSFKALGQALRNSLYVNYSWIVLPWNLVKKDFLQSLKEMSVGLITVNRELTFSIVKKSAGKQQPVKTLIIPKEKVQKNVEHRIFF